jgi:hypothetical protein
MSNYQMQEGQVTLFKNNKTTNNAPDYTGDGMYKGQKLRLAFWIKEGKQGKFLSGKISEPREQQSSSRHQENDADDLFL